MILKGVDLQFKLYDQFKGNLLKVTIGCLSIGLRSITRILWLCALEVGHQLVEN